MHLYIQLNQVSRFSTIIGNYNSLSSDHVFFKLCVRILREATKPYSQAKEKSMCKWELNYINPAPIFIEMTKIIAVNIKLARLIIK